MEFGRLITAMVTPFDADYRVNYKKACELADFLLDNGSDSLVVCGTTGESPTLSSEEKLRLFAEIKHHVGARAKIIAGTSCYETALSVELSKKAESLGVDAVLAVTPYYNKPPQDGIYAHFAAIAESVSLPVILYNVPSRTNLNMEPNTALQLAADYSNIVALKEACSSMDQVSELIRISDDDFKIYCGDDSLTLPMLSLGAVGVISVASHLVGNQMKKMIDDCFADNWQAARRAHFDLFPLMRKLFITSSPLPLKYCLNRIGWDLGNCRLPLTEPTNEQKQILDNMLKDYQLL